MIPNARVGKHTCGSGACLAPVVTRRKVAFFCALPFRRIAAKTKTELIIFPVLKYNNH